MAEPMPSQARRSSSSSGSVKRKLLSAFDSADGPPAHKPIRPNFNEPRMENGCEADQSAGGMLISNSDTNFDPDALFVSGFEEGELSMSGNAEEPIAVEVANPDRPPTNK
ncbi:hypothetical protein LINPERPRIM_LOCUS23552 [Linum perenne]